MIHCSLGPPKSATQTASQHTDTHIHRPHYISSNRLHLCTLCMRQSLIIINQFHPYAFSARRCWLGSRKGTWPVEYCLVGCWRGYLSGASCRLHMAQLMPLPLTVSCFSKIQTGFTFLVPARPGSPGKRAVKRVCVCSIHMQLHRNTAGHTNITLTENFRLLKISLCCQPTAKLHV